MADENKKYVLTKKRNEITAEERESVMRPLGIAALPFPTADLVKNDQGAWEYQLFVVQDSREPVIVFSDRDIYEVTGEMYRDMPVPAMMYLEQEILEHTDPERGDRVVFMLGDTGWGKTHSFKKIGRMLHPDGAIVVDMGGMNAQELVWKTVIDYGKGVQELFDKRLAEGNISEASLKLLQEEFPDSVVRTKGEGGETVKINWSEIGSRKRLYNEEKQKWESVEDRGDAVRRAKQIMDHIYDNEKISRQENSFGIKTVPGELWEAWESGRPFLADEITKAIPSTINSLQSVLEVMNGNNEYFRALNPIPESNSKGDNDSPPYLEFRKKDMRGSFLMALAGNEKNDGITTFDLSDSFLARGTVLNVGEEKAIDWAHRTSQIVTGLPVTTLNMIARQAIDADPEGYAGFLYQIRTLGLTADQIAQIPDHQLEAIKTYNATEAGANQVADVAFTQERLSREDPEFLKKAEFSKLVEEVSAKGKQLLTTPRKLIQLVNKALHRSARPRPLSEAKISFNVKETLANFDPKLIGSSEPAWRTLGENLSIAIRRDIANATVGMPLTRAALFQKAEEQGVTHPEFKEAETSKKLKPLSKLWLFEQHADAGGTQELNEMRSILLTPLRAQFKNLRGSDDATLPLDALARAVKTIEDKKGKVEHAFVVPNDDPKRVAEEPLVVASAFPIYEMPEPETEPDFELVDYRDAISSLVMPKYGADNLSKIYATGFVPEMLKPPKKKLNDDGSVFINAQGETEVDIEPYNIAEGKGEWGLNLTILRVADSKGNPANVWVIEDKATLDKPKDGTTDWHRFMLVGPEPISPQMQVDLAKKGMTYIVREDANTMAQINDFLISSARVRGDDSKLDPEAAKDVTEAIVKTFAIMYTLPRVKEGSDPKMQKIPSDATLGEMITTANEANEAPGVFVAVVKPRTAASGPKA